MVRGLRDSRSAPGLGLAFIYHMALLALALPGRKEISQLQNPRLWPQKPKELLWLPRRSSDATTLLTGNVDDTILLTENADDTTLLTRNAVSVPWGCCNKVPPTEWLKKRKKKSRNVFSHSSEGQIPKSRCWQGCAPSRGSGENLCIFRWLQHVPWLVPASLQSLPCLHVAFSGSSVFHKNPLSLD